MQRSWDAGRPVDLRATLGALRRGSGDPAHRVDDTGYRWACHTPTGPGTLALSVAGTQVAAQAWGLGAEWLLEQVPALLGEPDDWSALDVTAVPVLDRTRRARPGLRLPRTGLVLDVLVPAILEQKVTGQEAWRSWRQLVWRFGTPAPGPDERLRVPPVAQVLLDIPTWEWHRLGVDLRRQRTIRAAATVAARLEECVAMTPEAAAARLQLVPGIGVWTAAETVQRALGAPDMVSVGDYHLPNVVVHLLTGRARGTDEEMLELLAPWAGQRQRVMRLIEAAGIGAPRFGPRFAYPEIRAM
jgi:3-methyladenine DNA glycosylase/8-oxoguanine DNA glycosylase